MGMGAIIVQVRYEDTKNGGAEFIIDKLAINAL